MQTKNTQCHFCNNTCPVSVTVEGDKLLSVKRMASPGVPNRSFCPKNIAAPDVVHAPDRITSPLVRSNMERSKESCRKHRGRQHWGISRKDSTFIKRNSVPNQLPGSKVQVMTGGLSGNMDNV